MLPFLPPSTPFRVNLSVAARLLPAFVKRISLAETLRLATPLAGKTGYVELKPAEIVRAVVRATRRPWLMRDRRCLRQGVLAFHFLTLAGHRPVLHFGVVPSTISMPRPRAHCWVSVQGFIILNPPMEPMVEILAHDGRLAGQPASLARNAAVSWS